MKIVEKDKLNISKIKEQLDYGDIFGLKEIEKQFKEQGLTYLNSDEYEILKHTINMNFLFITNIKFKNKKIYSMSEELYNLLKNELISFIGLYEKE